MDEEQIIEQRNYSTIPIIPPTVADYKRYVENWKNHTMIPKLWLGNPILEESPFRKMEPIGRCGQYAVVFTWLGPSNEKYAVRFFTRPIDNRDEVRYLVTKILTEDSPYFVHFDYIKYGLWIEPPKETEFTALPIVLMDHARGKLLDEYLESKMNSPETLLSLASVWYYLILDLRKRNIAHGDLQHGNIIIDKKGRIKLVDYDGFYAELISHIEPREAGHPNYNHPNRRNEHYGPFMDTFASHVIYLSILALSMKPQIWKKYHIDDNLIFTRKDFKDPDNSELIKELLMIDNEFFNSLVQNLILMCKNEELALNSYQELPTITDELYKEIREYSGLKVATNHIQSIIVNGEKESISTSNTFTDSLNEKEQAIISGNQPEETPELDDSKKNDWLKNTSIISSTNSTNRKKTIENKSDYNILPQKNNKEQGNRHLIKISRRKGVLYDLNLKKKFLIISMIVLIPIFSFSIFLLGIAPAIGLIIFYLAFGLFFLIFIQRRIDELIIEIEDLTKT